MDFALTEQQESIRQMVRAFAEKEIEPHIDRWEEERHFPKHLFPGMARLGLAGMTCSERYGGSALDRVSMALVAEELGRVARSLSFIAVHNMQGGSDRGGHEPDPAPPHRPRAAEGRGAGEILGNQDGLVPDYGRRSATRMTADGVARGVMVASAPSVSIDA